MLHCGSTVSRYLASIHCDQFIFQQSHIAAYSQRTMGDDSSLTQSDSTASRIDFTSSTMFCFLCSFHLIECIQRCEIYPSESEWHIALSFQKPESSYHKIYICCIGQTGCHSSSVVKECMPTFLYNFLSKYWFSQYIAVLSNISQTICQISQ